MAGCEPIIGLKLDAKSIEALERIKEKNRLGQILATTVTAGVFNSIFTKNKAPVVGYNITQTDWELYAEAMKAIPIITKSSIQKEIDLMLLHYYMPGKYDHKHVQFWKGMKNGCQF